MGRERWEHEREGLRRLARVFAEEARGGLLGEALDVILDAAQIDAGAAFSAEGSSLELVAERALGSASDRPGRDASRALFKQALQATAQRVVGTRKPVFYPSLGRSDISHEFRTELALAGFSSLAAQPIKHQRDVLGVI